MKKVVAKIKKHIFDLKVEFNILTDTVAGDKPFQYIDELSKGENVYIASILGAIIAYETMLEYITSEIEEVKNENQENV